MLLQLTIKNLAIVEQIILNFANGMNVLTGETGAGKSILLDALSLTLGDRASSSIVRTSCKQAEISAVFELNNLSSIQQWLQDQDLSADGECIVRRIITIDGRSKAYINGNLVTIIQLKQLGEMLVNMNGQHQHHVLLDTNYQRNLIDQYVGHNDLLIEVNKKFKEWSALENEYKKLAEVQDNKDRLQLLHYQIREIEEIALQTDELENLENEQKKLLKSNELFTTIEKVLQFIREDEKNAMLGQLYKAIDDLKQLTKYAPELQTSTLLVEQAIIPLEELGNELLNFLSGLNSDPEKLNQVEDRLSAIYLLARKHNIMPEFLLDHYQILCDEKDKLENKNIRLGKIEQALKVAKDEYFFVAKELSKKREKTAKVLAKEIGETNKIFIYAQCCF